VPKCSHPLPISASLRLLREVSIVKKNTSNSPRAALPDETLDLWMHAVALVILRRQMRGRWTSGSRPLAATA
jgi:hypothetical protein